MLILFNSVSLRKSHTQMQPYALTKAQAAGPVLADGECLWIQGGRRNGVSYTNYIKIDCSGFS